MASIKFLDFPIQKNKNQISLNYNLSKVNKNNKIQKMFIQKAI